MQYFIIENPQQAGPFTVEQLRTKNITPETLVWAEGMTDWTPAWKVEELRPLLDGEPVEETTTTPPPFMPPTPDQAVENQTEEEKPEEKPADKKKIWIISGVVAVVLLFFMTCTNPSKDDHEDAVKKAVTETLNKASDMGGNDILSKAFSAITKSIDNGIINNAIDSLLEYHNYLIYSKCTINVDGKDHTVSSGFLGQVWPSNCDDIISTLGKVTPTLDKDDESNNNENAETFDGNKDKKENADDNSAHKSIEDKADEAANKIADRVSDKVSDKVNEKIDEVADSSTIDKIIDKILSMF